MADALIVQFNLLPELAVALHEAVADVVARTATEIADLAAYNAPVDTGFMQSSIYTVTKTQSTYGQGAGPPPGDSYMLDEVSPPADDHTAYVAVGANYGVYQEYGTSRMGAQPYLTPAAEAGQSFFTSWLSDLESEMRKRAHAP